MTTETNGKSMAQTWAGLDDKAAAEYAARNQYWPIPADICALTEGVKALVSSQVDTLKQLGLLTPLYNDVAYAIIAHTLRISIAVSDGAFEKLDQAEFVEYFAQLNAMIDKSLDRIEKEHAEDLAASNPGVRIPSAYESKTPREYLPRPAKPAASDEPKA
jgi:hypothetical protein